MLIKRIKEIRAQKKREKVYKGITMFKQYLDEMAASCEYTDEELNNMQRWFAEACVQYSQMFK